MPKYIFSQGTVRVERGVYRASNDKPHDFGVLIVVKPESQPVTKTEKAQDKRNESDETAI